MGLGSVEKVRMVFRADAALAGERRLKAFQRSVDEQPFDAEEEAECKPCVWHNSILSAQPPRLSSSGKEPSAGD
jgi:hypothetical protein